MDEQSEALKEIDRQIQRMREIHMLRPDGSPRQFIGSGEVANYADTLAALMQGICRILTNPEYFKREANSEREESEGRDG